MHIDQWPYSKLHDDLLVSDSAAEILESWLQANGDQVVWLRNFRENVGPETECPIEDLWRLYAFSRVLQVIMLRFQSGSADESDWPGPSVTLDSWCDFATRLGLTVTYPQRFSPFDCEITSAEYGNEDNQPISLVATQWPCLMLGDMLICRAGVSVVGGFCVYDANIATNSRLFWAYRRKTRPHEDLSHGWGSNSQWRTEFRRDYRAAGRVYYNVDGEHHLGAEPLTGRYETAVEGYPLNREERVELLTHRYFVVTWQNQLNMWPYEDKLVVET